MDGSAERCMEGVGDEKREDNDINRILLRYRPIAPKPVVGGSGVGVGRSSMLSGKRTKRKYVRVSGVRCTNREEKRIVTLQLLPERSDLEAGIVQLDRDGKNTDLRAVEQLGKYDNDSNIENNLYAAAESVGVRGGVIESWVTVESVTTEKRMLEAGGWCTENESWRSMNDNFIQHELEGDSCPGFVSKAESGRVEWVNEAYRRMVGCGSDVVLWLEIKEVAAAVISQLSGIRSFSCWVKVQYNEAAHRKGGVSIALPCDAWRLEGGGFAWRLDARAALCLGIVTDNDGCFRPG